MCQRSTRKNMGICFKLSTGLEALNLKYMRLRKIKMRFERKRKCPLEVISPQMSAAYAIAVQHVGRKVLPTSFVMGTLNREILYDLIQKTVCGLQENLLSLGHSRLTITFADQVRVVKVLGGACSRKSAHKIWWAQWTFGRGSPQTIPQPCMWRVSRYGVSAPVMSYLRGDWGFTPL